MVPHTRHSEFARTTDLNEDVLETKSICSMTTITFTLAAALLSSVFAVTSSVTPWLDYRIKLPAWRNERWAIIVPTPITYQPEVLSRLGSQSCNCIDGNLCPQFMEMLNYRASNTEELRRLTCGFKGFRPMVCCNQIVSQRTNYIPTSEVYPQIQTQIPQDYDHNCEQTFRPTTVQQRINPSPTPYHTPGVYYNIGNFGEEKIPIDDSYLHPTSERNYYNKRFSQDSGFHHERNYVTPRTYMYDNRNMNSNPTMPSNIPMNSNLYPDYIIKSHDVPMVYHQGSSNPSSVHFGSTTTSSMYPEFNRPTFKPSYAHSPSGNEQWNPKPESNHNPYHGDRFPVYTGIKPTGTEDTFHKYPNNHDHNPKHPFHPNFHPYHNHGHSNTEDGYFPNRDLSYPEDDMGQGGYGFHHNEKNGKKNDSQHDNHPNTEGNYFPNRDLAKPVDKDQNGYSHHHVHNNNEDPLIFHSDTFWIEPNSSSESPNINVTLNETQNEYNTSNIPRFTPRPDDSEGVVVTGRQAKRKLLPTIECGVPPGERIVGGKTAQLGEYPWIVRIGYTRSGSDALLYRCAGSLINNLYVLTAAHCVTNLPGGLQLSTIRLGELDERTDPDCYQSECGDSVQDYVASRIKVHEDYDKPRFRNDLALIRLDRPANFTNYISPICLPFDSLRNKSYIGLKADIAGWGATDLGGISSSPVLQWVRVTVIPTGDCAREFAERTNTRLGPGQICAGGERGRDSCEGDSGGPLMRGEQLGPEDFSRYYLLGLVSFGAKRCGSENLPGVYTEIPSYLDWILENIEP